MKIMYYPTTKRMEMILEDIDIKSEFCGKNIDLLKLECDFELDLSMTREAGRIYYKGNLGMVEFKNQKGLIKMIMYELKGEGIKIYRLNALL